MKNKNHKKVILYKADTLEVLQEYNGTEEACKKLEVSYEEFMEWRRSGTCPKGFKGFQVSLEVI